MTSWPSPDRRANNRSARSIPWMTAEPERLIRDLREVKAFAPLLWYRHLAVSRHGGWTGELPQWPFDRPEPDGLSELMGSSGLHIDVEYPAAYPMVPPTIYPVEPAPSIEEQTQSAWHVAPGGSLCLLQSEGAWRPEASVTELMAKAAGWRIEYALMKAGAIPQMSVNGIVSDPSFDHLVAGTNQTSDIPGPEERPGH